MKDGRVPSAEDRTLGLGTGTGVAAEDKARRPTAEVLFAVRSGAAALLGSASCAVAGVPSTALYPSSAEKISTALHIPGTGSLGSEAAHLDLVREEPGWPSVSNNCIIGVLVASSGIYVYLEY